jgi:hypothetical protein
MHLKKESRAVAELRILGVNVMTTTFGDFINFLPQKIQKIDKTM